MNDGGPACCDWCCSPVHRKCGKNLWLCVVHYRYLQMRTRAKRDGKSVPSYQELIQITPDPFVCPHCSCRLVWLAAEDQRRVITLQHNRDGSHQMLCRTCNTRHGAREGDRFYAIPLDSKECPGCKTVYGLDEFTADRSGQKFADKNTYCTKCKRDYVSKWRDANRDHYNRYQREYRARRKAAGN